MSTSHLDDREQRRRALDATRSFIVQAPAGSGKTELLIQRYLMLLARVDAPEEIVAITFTRKAAGEMRSRVLAALADARSGKSADDEHRRTTLELAREALRRDAAADWSIAENPARLRIQTVDSLATSLTSQMPMLSKFGSQPQIVEKAAQLYIEAARAVVALVEGNDQVAGDIEQLLVHLDNDVARTEQLVAAMLERRDHWLRRAHAPDRQQLEAALQGVRRAALARVCALLPEAAHSALTDLARYAAGNLKLDGRDSPLAACERLSVLPGAEESAVDAWLGIAELLLTKDGDWRKNVNVAVGFPPAGPRRHKDALVTLIATLRESEELRTALHELRRLPPPAYSDVQWEALGAITRLLPRAVGELKLVFQARGQVDFTEIGHRAVLALGEPQAPTDLALALDYRIRHLLVDEFQDTSISQFELVERLTAGWEQGDGRTVFVVGDPMQSIYRFRQAEVGLFLRARAAGIGEVALEPIYLSANFRSCAGIVEWVNTTFAQVMPRHEDIATGAVPYTATVAARGDGSDLAVNVHPSFNDDYADEARRVLDIIAVTRRENDAATIAILVRNRGHLSEIVPQLKRAGLRFRAIEIELLDRRPVVQDLLALTHALTHPADRLAWLALLRAPWCGLTLADLLALAGDDRGRTVLESITDDARLAALSSDGRVRLKRVREVLTRALADRARGSLRERVAGTWFALGGPACVEDPTDLEDAEIYFDYLESFDQAGDIADRVAFEQGLQELYALPDVEADERLQVMTIHRAKGLEFDCVIVPGLGRTPRSDDKRLFLWMEQPRADAGGDTARSVLISERPARSPDFRNLADFNSAKLGHYNSDLLLAPIQATGAESDRIYRWLERREGERTSLEEARLLYVAATRAREHLHLLGSARLALKNGAPDLRVPSDKTLLGMLWPQVGATYVAAAAQALPGATTGQAHTNAIDSALRRLASDWVAPTAPTPAAWKAPADFARDQDAIEFSWVGESARHVGAVVHRWLQQIAEDQMRDWSTERVVGLRESFRHELIARGVGDADMEDATARVVSALTQAIGDERGRWLLGVQNEARNELRITALIDGEFFNLVIDRTFRGADGKRWIVDYKTSRHEGADIAAFLDREQERYRAQLARYARALGVQHDARLGLYFPLLAGWREWQEEKPQRAGAQNAGHQGELFPRDTPSR